MSYLGRRGALAPLTSADIPVGIVEGTDVAFLENSSGQTLAGTYSTERMYLSGRTGSAPNDYNYKLEGNVTVTGHLALGSIADEDIVITQDGTERTITGSGTLEAGELLSSKETDLTGMTGELANSVQDNITRLGTVTAGSIGSGVTGFSGVKIIDQWRIHSPITNLSGVITTNFERVDGPSGYGTLGSAMTQSSGVFTFPSTGIWGVQAQFRLQESGGPFRNFMQKQITVNNGSNWYTFGYMEQGYSYWYTTTASLMNFVDITDTSTCKVQFKMTMAGSAEKLYGETDQNQTAFTFIRFGDT